MKSFLIDVVVWIEELISKATALVLTTLLVLFLLYPIIPEAVWESKEFTFLLFGGLAGILYLLALILLSIVKHAYLDWRKHKA